MIIGQPITAGGGTSSSEVTAAKAQVLVGYNTITSDSNDEIAEGTLALENVRALAGGSIQDYANQIS